MANREIAASGQGVYPLTGDLESQAGISTVKVVGIQTVPVESTLPDKDGELLFYRLDSNEYKIFFVNDAVSVDDEAISLNTILNVAGTTLVGAVDVDGTPIG